MVDSSRADGADAPGALVLPDGIRSEILARLLAVAPREGVGLLATERDMPGGVVTACRYYPGTNRDASATRYTMDPEEVLAGLLKIEERGWRLGGIVHSHPAGPATPSPTDRREYRYPEALMIIVSLAGGEPDLRAWWLGDRDGAWPAEVPVAAVVTDTPALGQEEKTEWST